MNAAPKMYPFKATPGRWYGLGFYLGPVRLTFLSYYGYRPRLIWAPMFWAEWSVASLRWP